jgi:ATP-binding cassette subfamily B protein
MESLERLAIGRTTVLVTHDLAQAARADEILYLEQGRILERGAHRELVAAGGRYALLYRLQDREQEAAVRIEAPHAYAP